VRHPFRNIHINDTDDIAAQIRFADVGAKSTPASAAR
jgi:hypothetical protein